MLTVIGNEAAKSALLGAIREQRIAGCYILEGGDGTGKLTLARYAAAAICCAHPREDASPCGVCHSCRNIAIGNHIDVPEVRPEEEGKRITVAQIREVLGFTHVSATEGDWRIIIIDDGHCMKKEAQNALLKSIEEPTEHTVFFLLTNDRTKLLPTVRSRSVFLRTAPLQDHEIREALKGICDDPKRLDEIVLLSGGSLGKAKALLSDEQMPQIRRQVLDYFSAIMEGAGFTRLSLIIPPSYTGRQEFSLILAMIKSALRDLICYKTTPRTKPIFFTDSAFLSDMASILCTKRAALLMEQCDTLLASSEQNVNLISAIASLHLAAKELTGQDED